VESLITFVHAYKQFLEQGENLTVIDIFYDEQIVQIENDQAPVACKQTLRLMEEENLRKVSHFKQLITSLLIDESQNIVMGEMTVEFTGKQAGPKRLNQAFVQQWKNGKICLQRFYYGGFLPATP
jgi:hypothetical protein